MAVKIKTNSKKVVQSLVDKIKKYEPDSEQMNAALQRIGNILRNRMIMNATRQQIVNTGALRNSLTYRVNKNTVIAGSFGVRYARFHEFGAYLHPAAVRAMFAAMGRQVKGKRKGQSKGVFTGSPTTGGYLRARPFVIPAFISSRNQILTIIKENLKL